MTDLLSGVDVSNRISEELKASRADLERCGLVPKLAVVQIGNNADDVAYANSAAKKCAAFGVESNVFPVAESCGFSEFAELFDRLNGDDSTDGILILGSYPTNQIREYVQGNIVPRKDVDGIGYVNIARLYSADPKAVVPCTAQAVLELLDHYGIDVSGKKLCVVGRSLIIGRPLAISLTNRSATVTVCHSRTHELDSECRDADIVCCSIGKGRFFTAKFFRPESVVIDVGINFDENGKLCGDVDFESVSGHVKALTPVPRGVGSITNAVLVKHILESCASKIGDGA